MGSRTVASRTGICWLVLVLVVSACPRATTTTDPRTVPAEVEVIEEPPIDEMMVRAKRELDQRQLAAAHTTMERVLERSPDYLEGQVLMALVQEALGNEKKAVDAWNHVERILVFAGMVTPFEHQSLLFAAARHYINQENRARSELFLADLWRRFPDSEWSVRAQLLVAETAFSARRWSQVPGPCEALMRLRPTHAAAKRCKRLVRDAIRMLEIGPQPSPEAPRWAWEHPLPQGNSLNDVWVSDREEVFAVGEAGTIIYGSSRNGERGSDSENRFALMDSGTRWSLKAVWGTASNNIYAVGAAGIVLHFDGSRWTVSRPASPEQPDLWGVFSAGPGHAAAVGDQGTVVTLKNGSWQISRPTAVALRGIWGTDPANLFVVGAEGTLLRLHGGRWETLNSDCYEDLWSIWGASVGHVWAVGNRKTVVHFDGKKATENVVGRCHFRDTWGFGTTGAWAVGTQGGIARFTGRSWRSESSGTLVDLLGVAGGSVKNVWAVGDGGTLLVRRANRWRLVSGGLQQKLVAITAGSSSGEAFALGEKGILLRRKEGRWKVAQSLPLPGRYRDMWSDGKRWIAVGDRGLVVARTSDGWERLSIDTTEDLSSVWGWEGGGVAVGTRGTVVRISGHARAQREPTPTGLDLTDVWGASPDALVAVGTRGAVLRFDGKRWTSEQSGILDDLHAIWGTKRAIYAVGSGGTIIRSSAGSTWRTIDSPISQKLVDVWGGTDGRLFAVSDRGGIISYDGNTWTVQRSPAANLTAVHGDPSIGVLAVGPCGIVIGLQKKPGGSH